MAKAKRDDNGQILIRCPGCKYLHALNVDPANGRPCWTFNGDMERPTFSPSLLERAGHYVPGQPPVEKCFVCNAAKEEGCKTFCGICHSFIRDGNIEFLSDCTHELAGKTVPLPEI